VLVGLVLCWVIIAAMFKAEMAGGPAATAYSVRGAFRAAAQHEGQTLSPSSLPLQTGTDERDNYLIAKALIILAALVVYFLLKTGPGASEARAVAALTGAGLLLCSHRAKAAKLYQLVDWNLLLLFFGLFVVNGAMKERHLMADALAAIQRHGVNLNEPIALSAATAALSNLVSNVPAVLLLEPTLTAAHSAKLWYLLALISTWAGNLTLVGSIANLIVAESAAAFGVEVRLGTYCKVGVPLTLITIALGTAWVLWVM
jgi:Na+/H+ antiporter NhaD/arsenite permease-like protein